MNDFASFQEPKHATACGHDDDAKLLPVETAAKPESKVSLAGVVGPLLTRWVATINFGIVTTHQ